MRYVQPYPSCVYFARNPKDQLIKIGYSVDVNARLVGIKSFQKTGTLELMGLLPGGEETEKLVHSRFAHLRTEGEWFVPGPELLTYIELSTERPVEVRRGLSFRSVEKVVAGYSLPEQLFRSIKWLAYEKRRSASEEVAKRLALSLGLEFDWLDPDEQFLPLSDEAKARIFNNEDGGDLEDDSLELL